MAKPPSFGSFPSLAPVRPPSFDSFPVSEAGPRRTKRSRSRSRSPDDGTGGRERRKRKDKSTRDGKEHGKEKRKDKGKLKQEPQDDDEAGRFLEGIGKGLGVQRPPRPAVDATAPTQVVDPSERRRSYQIDLKADNFNLRSGKPDRGKVPRFRRTGAGRILGMHQSMRIAIDSAYTGNGLHVTPHGRRRVARLGDASSAALLSDRNLKRVALQPRRLAASTDAMADQAFVPLSEKADSTGAKTQARDASDLLYADSGSSADEADPFDLPDEEGAESVLDRLNRRKADLESRTRRDPTDVSAWLACVALQDELRASGLANIRSSANRDQSAVSGRFDADDEAARRQVRGTAEIQLSYLDRALGVEKNKGDLDLIRAYLKAYSSRPDVDFPRIDRKWRDMLSRGAIRSSKVDAGAKRGLKEEQGRMALWVDYIAWRMSDGSTFKVDEIVRLVEEGMDSVRRDIEAESWDSPKRAAGEQTLLYLFHRCCIMLRQAGHTERSLALAQAIIELNFFPPPRHAWSQLRSDASPDDIFAAQHELIEDFEIFWDGEAPRIGEPGAVGWCSTSEDADPPPEQSTSHAIGAQIDGDPVDAWSVAERVEQLRKLKPARLTDTLVDVDDPYRVVVFEDLRNLLFAVCSAEARQQLSYSFLACAGLQLAPPEVSTDSPFFADAFLTSDIVDNPEAKRKLWRGGDADDRVRPRIAPDGHAPELVSGIRRPFASPFKAFPGTVQSLFSPADAWFIPFDGPDLNSVDVAFLRRAFALLRPRLRSDVYFSLCALSFESRADPAAAARLCKAWLADDASNIRLWDAHARVARLRGKLGEARNVYVTALSMASSLRAEAKKDLTLLWVGWVELELASQRGDAAMAVLVGMAGGAETDAKSLLSEGRPGGAALLRARKAFSQRLAAAFKANALPTDARHRVEYVSASATLEYLSKGLEAATEVFDHALKLLDHLGSLVEEETLWLEYCRLLYHHIGVSASSYRPTQIRGVLRRAVERFPQNSAFLALFAWNEARMRIQNETRRMLASAVLGKPEAAASPNSWLFAIWVELHLDAAGYSAAAVRDLFERGLANEKAQFSAQLWCLYIEFEVRHGDPKRAGRVVARAMATCPWSKDAYLFAFSRALLGIATRQSDLERICRVMEEKMLRVTHDVRPLLKLAQAPEDAASEDEVESADRLDRANATTLLL